jgi:septum formation protein
LTLALLVLASGSPRRAHILRTLSVPFEVRVSDVDEALRPGETGLATAERLAQAKAERVAATEWRPVLGADTVVVCEGRILNKPLSRDEAGDMLRLLSGRSHQVVTGLCLAYGGHFYSGTETTEVTFAPLGEDEIAWYLATGEPFDKAGGYHVDGRGALFITGVHGSPSNVAGLPVRLFLVLARRAGLSLGLA